MAASAGAALLKLTLPSEWLHLIKLVGDDHKEGDDVPLEVLPVEPVRVPGPLAIVEEATQGQLSILHLVTLSNSVDLLVDLSFAIVTLVTTSGVPNPAESNLYQVLVFSG